MVEIIPALLVQDEKEFRRKIDSIAGLVDTVQIDVMDGKFVENVSWGDAERVGRMPLAMDFEVHLMVEDPESHLDAWSRSGCGRAIIHAEAVKHPEEALKQIKLFGMEPGLAINPETPVSAIESAIPHAAVVQVMGVHPGAMGRPFEPSTVAKVKELRARWPDLVIAVDGGVAVGTARELAEAGADRLVSGSFIFNGAPAKAIEALQADAEHEA